MSGTELKQRLAAILAADVAGYSRLMAVDERATVAALDSARKVFRSRIESNQGRVIDMAGDSVLAVFETATGAVSAALAVQQELNASSNSVPEDRRMRFRIGVHMGDVIEKADGTVYGDGVNIAARLEGLAEPGGITVSESIRTAVKGKVSASFEDQGAQQVKNISEPVRAFRVVRSGDDDTSASANIGAALSLPDKPSLAVLPFTNLSGDPEQEYFADGIAEDLITDLSKISGLFVIARNSSFTYRGKATDVRHVAKVLGVRFVLEGSVRKVGGRVRITAQLVDGASGGHLWAERYDRDLTDIFAVQDEVTQHIVSALSLKLTRDERQRLARKGTENLEAYEWYLKGRELYWRFTRDAIAQAKPMFERTIALDPGFAAAYARLAGCHNLEYINGWSESPEESQRRAYELALKAVSKDAVEPQGHYTLGTVRLWRKELEPAIAATEKAIALDPNFAPSYATLGLILHYAGRSAESLDLIAKAMRLDPHYPDMFLHFVGQAYFALGQYEEAAAALKRRLVRNPNTDVSRVLLAACYGHLGQPEAACAEWREALRINPAYSLENRRRILPYKDPRDFERVVDGLRKAGLPEC